MNEPATVPSDAMTVEFLPLHKGAFGIATGMAAAILIFAATLATVFTRQEPVPPLHLLSQYFAGYTVSVAGAFIGAAWGGFTGFVMGWFLAFSRNALVAITVIYLRTRAEWTQTRDFLDHI